MRQKKDFSGGSAVHEQAGRRPDRDKNNVLKEKKGIKWGVILFQASWVSLPLDWNQRQGQKWFINVFKWWNKMVQAGIFLLSVERRSRRGCLRMPDVSVQILWRCCGLKSTNTSDAMYCSHLIITMTYYTPTNTSLWARFQHTMAFWQLVSVIHSILYPDP